MYRILLNHKRSGLATAGAALAVTAIVILLSGGTARSAGVSTAALSEYSTLQRAEAPADTLPADATPASLARRIPIANSGVDEWITLTGEKLCIVINGNTDATSGAPGACNSVERLQATGQLLLTSGSGGPPVAAGAEPSAAQTRATYWAGLVPDGVTNLVAHYSDGSTQPIEVVDNGFYLATPEKTVTSFSWIADGRTHSEGGWQ